MAQFGQTFDTYDAIGRREDLSDVIYNIAPTETPGMMMIGRGKASQTLSEWQSDTLAAAAQNAQIEGDDITSGTALSPTTRLGNRTQISWKVPVVTGTEDAVDKAGRKNELAYQVAKSGQELKRDMELIITTNFAAVTGNSTTARQLGSMESWIVTNRSVGAGGGGAGHTAPGVIAAPTDGTQRALTEPLLKTVLQLVWTAGGNPTKVLVGPFNKQVISGFTGSATRFDKSEDKRLVTAIDVYVSDFGDHQIVPGRFNRDRTALVLDPSLWAVLYLRPFAVEPLAKTGDAEKRLLRVEYTLRCSNEAGSGKVADLLTS